MSKVYVLRGRTVAKTEEEEIDCALLYTFSEVYADKEAAIAALKMRVQDSADEIEDAYGYDVSDSLFEDYDDEENDIHHIYREYTHEPNENNPEVAEWSMSSKNTEIEYPNFPYFIVECREVH